MRSECFSIEPFLYATEKRAADWSEQLEEPIRNCDAFVYMAGGTEGRTQRLEANWHFRLAETADRKTVFARLPGGAVPDRYHVRGAFDIVHAAVNSSDPAEHIAIEIAKRLTGRWIPPDGIPSGYIFDYEKDIVEFPSTPDGTSKVCRTILPLKS